MQRKYGAPETSEIEVTPAMIEAGLDVLWKSGAVEYPTSADRDLVQKIYLSMAEIAACPGGGSCHQRDVAGHR